MKAPTWRQLGLVRRSAHLDTPHLIMVGRAAHLLLRDAAFTEAQVAELLAVPVQGGVMAEDRLREALAVWSYWTVPEAADLLVWAAGTHNTSWHALVEPAHWADVQPTLVFAFVDRFLHAHTRWPTVSQTRQEFGKAPTRRGAGDVPGQEPLL